MQFVAFDVGDDFVVEADLVQVAAAVIQIVDLSAVGQDGGGAVAVEVVVVAEGMAQRIGALGRQTVLAVFVGSGVAFGIGMGGQTTSKKD